MRTRTQSVYCVLALYVPPYIIKLASMVYVCPENRDPTDFGMGPTEGLIRPWGGATARYPYAVIRYPY